MVDLPRLDDDPVRGVLVADLEESILDESHHRAAPALSVSISYQKIHMVDNGRRKHWELKAEQGGGPTGNH